MKQVEKQYGLLNLWYLRTRAPNRKLYDVDYEKWERKFENQKVFKLKPMRRPHIVEGTDIEGNEEIEI